MFIRLKRHKKLLIIVYIPILIFTITMLIPINYTITAPGDIETVDGQIIIEDKEGLGSLYTVYVASMPKVTLFQAFLAFFDEKMEIRKKVPSDLSYLESYTLGQLTEELSYQYAIINAYKEAKKIDNNINLSDVLMGYVITYVSKYTRLKTGDVLIEVDGIHYNELNYDEWIKPFSLKDEVNVQIKRNGEHVNMVLSRSSETNLYGFSLNPVYEISTTPRYTSNYDRDFIGGPSGGLMQSLYIYSVLVDLDYKDIKVAGTGTIDESGNIGEIGGIKQKVWAVQQSAAIDVFYVPYANYDEALQAYQSIKNPRFVLIGVGDFNETVADLSKRLQSK